VPSFDAPGKAKPITASAEVETIDAKQIKEACKGVLASDVCYRFVNDDADI